METIELAEGPDLGTQVVPLDQEVEREGPRLGKSGLRHWAGYLSEEFLPELRGTRGYKIFDEMRRNEPTVAGLMTGITSIIQSVDWMAVPDDAENGADVAASSFVNKALTRIDRPFDEVVADQCTTFPFGWSLLETVYKYADGKVWWDSFVLLGQDSLYKWRFDERSNPVAFIQRPAPTYEEIEVPLEKCLLFRTNAEKNNPEGLSILRAAYKPYFYKKVVEEIEAMGAERDLLGIPVMNVPYGATSEEVDAAQKIVESVKNDDQSGLVMTAIGPDPHQRFEFKLVTGQGSAGKVSFTDRLVQRYTVEMAMVALANFVHLGGTRGGATNYALNSDVRDLFQVAVKNWMGKLADVWNRKAIPNLLAMNGMSGKCHLEHGRITQLNLQTITNFMTAGVQNKFITPTRELENFLRKEAELPPLPETEDAASDAPPAPPPNALPASLQGGGEGGPGNPASPPTPPKAPDGNLPNVGDKGQNGGLNANPGQNQKTTFQTNAASGGLTKVAPGAKTATEELREMLSELDDSEVWEEFTLKTVAAFAGGFWE